MAICWETAAGTDIGRVRQGNEDTYHVDPERGLLLVADGMGGHAAGEVASALAAKCTVDALTKLWDEGAEDDTIYSALEQSFFTAQHRIITCCSDDPRTRGMGTTLTAMHLGRAGGWSLGHIGDSRAYRLRDASLTQLTRDHTWVQREVDEGRLPARAAATHHRSHILTRVLSDDGDASPDMSRGTALPGDVVLLATDGLHGLLDDAEIAEILMWEASLEERVHGLISAVNARGGTDNITAVLARIREA
ncbi:MAG TPA: protein phosphatase 2C domain-containing protein [Longimicrobiaceae bacterium]|nr:protein phosphatase 2C domain-containing protein [Longimicrobiaceae bacterium]